MVVTTGNKSEMSVGYATLYGDMNGGFNPIKDLYKMEVYRLSALRNRWKPTGALGPGRHRDPREHPRQGARPPSCARTRRTRIPCRPTRMLDDILRGLVEDEMRVSEIVAKGHDLETVKKVERLLYLAEYKRRQAAPGVKVTRKNFGRDRRYPIVNRFRDQGLERTRRTRRWSAPSASRGPGRWTCSRPPSSPCAGRRRRRWGCELS